MPVSMLSEMQVLACQGRHRCSEQRVFASAASNESHTSVLHTLYTVYSVLIFASWAAPCILSTCPWPCSMMITTRLIHTPGNFLNQSAYDSRGFPRGYHKQPLFASEATAAAVHPTKFCTIDLVVVLSKLSVPNARDSAVYVYDCTASE